MAADYLKLCYNPTKDLRRWIAEDRRHCGTAARSFSFTEREGQHHAHTTQRTALAHPDGLRGIPLQKLCGGVDKDRQGGRRFDGVPSRSGSDFGRYNELRQVREEGRGVGGEASALNLEFGGELAALRSLYRAKIEATRRRGLPAHEVAAAIRALLDEQSGAFRALTARKDAARVAVRERSSLERFAARELTWRRQDGQLRLT